MTLNYQEERHLVNKILVEEAVQKLSLVQRLVLALRVNGFTYYESSTITGIAMSRYGGVLKKARRTLKTLLGGMINDLA